MCVGARFSSVPLPEVFLEGMLQVTSCVRDSV